MQTERSEAPRGADPMIGAPEAMGVSSPEASSGTGIPPDAAAGAVAPAPPEFNEPPGDSRSRPKRIALFVVHGMGQQMPFEAIDMVARGLVCGVCRRSGQDIDDTHAVRTRTVRFDVDGEQKVCERAEIEVEPEGPRMEGQSVHVHIYEAYWAPVTEGVVRGRDILDFLWNGLRSGLVRSLTNNVRRWMFGEVRELQQTRSAFTAFLLTGLVLLGLLVLNVLATTIVTARIFSSKPEAWPDDELMVSLTIIAGLVFLALFLFLGGFAGLVTAVGGLALVVVVAMDAWGEITMAELPESMAEIASPPVMWYVVWGLLFLVSLYTRQKVIQYVGDVVAYVDSSRLDRFDDVRRKIKKTTFDLLHAIYSVRTTDGNEHYYDDVALIGHSLGSVIAYDALNGMINDDLLSSPDGDPAGTGDRVIDRTRLFLTFGSPLDKTAYLFTILARKSASVRERLATSKQPLINDWRYRGSMRWVNIWAPGDLIAGELNHYGLAIGENEEPPDVPAIINARDPHAVTPLVAHVQYWENDRVFDEVVASLNLSGTVRNLG